MSPILSANVFTARLVSLLLDVSVKSLFLFVIAGIACLALRRASAASRHALWLLTIVGLTCLPFFCACLPQWAVFPRFPSPSMPSTQALAVRPVFQEGPTLLPEAGAAAPPVTPRTVPQDAAPPASFLPREVARAIPSVQPAPDSPSRRALSPAEWCVVIWLTGFAAVLSQTLIGLVAARRLVRRCRVVSEGPLVEAASQARRTLGVARPILVREGKPGAFVAVPMTFGAFHPAVLLCQGAADWPADRLRVVLLHETAHVRRWDWLTMVLARITCALYWFHPLVWLAAHRLRVESEAACDDLVLICGVPAPDYAASLLEIVQALAARSVPMPVTVAMAGRREVSGRLDAILAVGKNRAGVTWRGLAVAAALAVSLTALLAALRPVTAAGGGPIIRPRHEEQATTFLTPSDLGESPTHLAPLMAGHSKWEKQLPDGTRVRLLFIGAEDAQYSVTSTWTPDGVLQQGALAMRPALIYGKSAYQFFYAVTFPSAERQNTAVISYSQAGERAGMTEGVTHWHHGEAARLNFPASFPQSQTQATVLVNVAAGPEKTLIAGPPRTGATRRLSTGETITMTKAYVSLFPSQYQPTRAVEVIVTLPSRFVSEPNAYQFYPVDQSGRPLRVQHTSSNIPDLSKKTARMGFVFRSSEMPLDKVMEFRFTYRPSLAAVFRGVALRPTAPPPAKVVRFVRDGRKISQSNLHWIASGLLSYAADHDLHLPDAAHWMDQVIPYLVPAQISGEARRQRIAGLFHDPLAPSGQTWSYAYNRALSNLDMRGVNPPNQIVAVFESNKGTRNASDGGQSVPRPGWHQGGSDYAYLDSHVNWSNSTGTVRFAPLDSAAQQEIPIAGRIYDPHTLKPLRDTFVIFSRSPEKVTPGSVWPSSFTGKTGRFQSMTYPGRNYLMVLADGRFLPITSKPGANGIDVRVNDVVVGPALQGMSPHAYTVRSSSYLIHLFPPHGYSLLANFNLDEAAGPATLYFVPIAPTAPPSALVDSL